MGNIIIRKAQPKDAMQYHTLGLLVWRDAYKHIFPEEVFVEKEAKINKKIATFAQDCVTNNNQIVLVAESDSKIIAFMFGLRKSNYQHFADMGYADLVALYIHPNFQHKGLGRKLKDKFVEWAKQNGATKFVIGVLKDNKQGRSAYEKWGGKLESYTQPFVKLGKEYPEVFYTFDI